MKLLLALGDDAAYRLIVSHAQPLGFETVRYSHIAKAMDNLDEIDPAGIIISAKDFPRHWKVMAQFAGNKCPVVLLAGDELDDEESSKARHLAVNIAAGEASIKNELAQIKDKFLECPPVANQQPLSTNQTAQKPVKRHSLMQRSLAFFRAARIGFVFNVPGDMTLITGHVKEISPQGLSFEPDHAEVLQQLKTGTEFKDCSLRAGNSIISPVCRLVRSGDVLSIEFVSFQNGEQKLLDNRLKEFS